MRSSAPKASSFATTFLAAALLWCACLPAARVLAEDEPAAGDEPGDRATSFQAVEGAVKEDVPGGSLMVGAYAFVWLAVLGYVFRLGRLTARADQDVQLLRRALGKSAGAASRDDDSAKAARE